MIVDYTKQSTIRAFGRNWPSGYRDKCPVCGRLGLPRPITNPAEFWHKGIWDETKPYDEQLIITDSCTIGR